MQCPKCNGDVWDNRAKKAEGKFRPNAPDFSCRDKSCGWNSGFGKAGGIPIHPQAPIVAPSAPQPQNGPSVSPRDTLIQELFWDSFDAVLQGIAKRKLVDWAKPETVASLTATMFIQRSKG